MEELALASHERAIAAWDNGWFDDEVTPYGDVARDKRPRRDTTREKMAALKTLTPDGLLTAAKASQISDGCRRSCSRPRNRRRGRCRCSARFTGLPCPG